MVKCMIELNVSVYAQLLLIVAVKIEEMITSFSPVFFLFFSFFVFHALFFVSTTVAPAPATGTTTTKAFVVVLILICLCFDKKESRQEETNVRNVRRKRTSAHKYAVYVLCVRALNVAVNRTILEHSVPCSVFFGRKLFCFRLLFKYA